MRAGIALGSNLGDRRVNLKSALEQISAMSIIEPPILTSSIYETEPVDCPAGSPLFLNGVMEVGCNCEPITLLGCLREVEESLGRTSLHEHNAARTIDLDLLYFGDAMLSIAMLQLPHPRLHKRRFVLEPLGEIRPDLVLPGQSEDVATLLRDLHDATPLVRIASEW
jgi:2-amino-4-hydroxy-6-hydroxymethyldihydropteridine diphosphokinase